MNQQTEILVEKLKTSIEEYEFQKEFILKNFIRSMVWKLVSTQDSDIPYEERLEHDLDVVVKTILNTARSTERDDGEDYPIWDKGTCKAELKRIKEVLQKAGMTYDWSWHF